MGRDNSSTGIVGASDAVDFVEKHLALEEALLLLLLQLLLQLLRLLLVMMFAICQRLIGFASALLGVMQLLLRVSQLLQQLLPLLSRVLRLRVVLGDGSRQRSLENTKSGAQPVTRCSSWHSLRLQTLRQMRAVAAGPLEPAAP
jgi:hypothetical protein